MRTKVYFFWAFLLLSFAAKPQINIVSGVSNGQGSLIVNGKYPAEQPGAASVDYIVIDSIVLEHNNVTRDKIILRELLFSQGDTISSSHFLDLAEQSRQNLLNTSLFNFVEILVDLDDEPLARVQISFVERWYLWPFPILELGERNLNVWLDNPRFSRLNYGLNLTRFNFRGRNETIALLLRLGYKQNFSVSYMKPYFNRAQTLGLAIDAGMNMRHELAYITRDNQQVFYSKPTGVVYRQLYFESALIYRPAIHNTHTFSLGFNQHKFADTLLILNPQFSPGNQSLLSYFFFSYLFKNDHRDLKAYPLQGHYFDVRITHKGFGLLSSGVMDVSTIETSARKFWKLSPRWYTAGGFNSKLSRDKGIAYFNQQGLGFKGDLVRGFEKYVIDGQHFFVLKSNLKYALVPQRSSKIRFIENPRFSLIHYAFYMNVYADAGIIKDRLFADTNPLANQWLAGAGVGIDLVTYYDRVFRVEWSFNSLGESGLFFHMLAPI